MNELTIEHEEAREEAKGFELNDCGQASKVTRGAPLLFLFELGTPPFNKLFLV